MKNVPDDCQTMNQPYETLRIFKGPDAYLPETKSRTSCATSMESSSLPMGILRIMLAEDGVGQVLMALTGVKVGGNLEWLNPFIADTRPHIGQEEASANMRTFVAGSKLVTGIDAENDLWKTGLCQDRYATRTSPQWIGPQLEDLMLAHQQVATELNSTSGNPLVDVSGSEVHSGGNFHHLVGNGLHDGLEGLKEVFVHDAKIESLASHIDEGSRHQRD